MLEIWIRIHQFTARSTPHGHISARIWAYIEGTYVYVYMHMYGPSRSSDVDSDVYKHMGVILGNRIWQPYIDVDIDIYIYSYRYRYNFDCYFRLQWFSDVLGISSTKTLKSGNRTRRCVSELVIGWYGYRLSSIAWKALDNGFSLFSVDTLCVSTLVLGEGFT
jgi:hypothetical protein